jgi:hypothetical protein
LNWRSPFHDFLPCLARHLVESVPSAPNRQVPLPKVAPLARAYGRRPVGGRGLQGQNVGAAGSHAIRATFSISAILAKRGTQPKARTAACIGASAPAARADRFSYE